MKVTELRLGNLLAPIYQPETPGAIIALSSDGIIHLHNRETADDFRNLSSIPLTEELLEKIGYESTLFAAGHEVSLNFTEKRIGITINSSNNYRIRFLHELQNTFFINTGQELFDPYQLFIQ